MEQSHLWRWISLRRVMALAMFCAILGIGLGRLTSSAPRQILIWAATGFLLGTFVELGLCGLHWLATAYLSPRNESILRYYGLAGLWLLGLPIFVWGGFDAQASFGAWYGQVQAYPWLDVIKYMVLSGLVMLILYGIIRPWSFRYSIGRLTLSLIALLVGFVMVASRTIDPPGFQTAVVAWLLLIIGVLFVMLSLTFRVRKTNKPS